MTRLDDRRWTSLWQRIPATGDARFWFDRLSALYSEPHRHYHTARHINECLAELDSSATAADPVAVELALWFHDALYDTRAQDNEEKSALLADDCLRTGGAAVALSLREAVQQLILVTKTHTADAGTDAALLMDIDLSILGKDEPRFWEYESQVRQEYSWVSDENFARGRAEIIERFLRRDRIYRTDAFYRKYESQARANLEASVRRLKAQFKT